ncbi:hypothetical protein F8388_002205 [Cannabis sativa]|uniref:Uncharacterized protein n=1 Tax=Cannabis sativa TaxID=3483 RepID=A0A7J6FUL6_CANSA|nr:hypothetical protein F8388_002205 [Cannabis sativa]KAF4377447.1 hypothetical protein G4B88_026400 [Cannabis sativa]
MEAKVALRFKNEVNNIKDFERTPQGSTITFLVTDSTSYFSILKQLKVPFSDIEEKVVHINKEKALPLLLCLFVSENALTNTFMKKF